MGNSSRSGDGLLREMKEMSPDSDDNWVKLSEQA